MKPSIVEYGNALEKRYTYTADGAIKPGDLVRITTEGKAKVAAINSSTTGAVHGLAVCASDRADGDDVTVLLFTGSTVLKIQCIDSVAPEDLSVGVTYTLETSGGVWGVTSTTTNGIATVTDTEATSNPWDDRTGTYDYDVTEDNNVVRIKFAQAILDAHGAS